MKIAEAILWAIVLSVALMWGTLFIARVILDQQ